MLIDPPKSAFPDEWCSIEEKRSKIIKFIIQILQYAQNVKAPISFCSGFLLETQHV